MSIAKPTSTAKSDDTSNIRHLTTSMSYTQQDYFAPREDYRHIIAPTSTDAMMRYDKATTQSGDITGTQPSQSWAEIA